MRRLGFAALGLSLWLFPRPAEAFSDPTVFAEPSEEGGGSGRYFTGSPVDGFGCGVCHEGGKTPSVSIEGLPTELDPLRRYEVTVRWDNTLASQALALELTGPEGAHPGTELPGIEALPAASRCEGNATGEPAVYLENVGKRRIVGVQDCGATELRFAFTAPEDAPLDFALGVVASDGSATPLGDGALEIRRTLYPAGKTPALGGGACSFQGAPPAGAPHYLVGLTALGLFRRRRGGEKRDERRSHKSPWEPHERWRPSLLGLALVFFSHGCFAPDSSADYLPVDGALRTPVEAFGGAPPAPAVCEDDVFASGLRELRFSVRTSSAGGQFAPRNVGAIWIEDESEHFVKTLERWGKTRAKWLKAFNAASDGNLVDAVTGATEKTHGTRDVVWDLEDVRACEAPHGSYRIAIEMTDRSGAGPTLYIPFDKNDDGTILTPEDAPTFHDMLIELE